MHRKIALVIATLAVLAGTLVAYPPVYFTPTHLTPMSSVALVNSTIDNTPIGNGRPSNGVFTVIKASSQDLSVQAQGAYTMWNLAGGPGETDFVNLRGLGPGGWKWFNGTSGTTLVPEMSLDPANSGTLTVANLAGNASSATVAAALAGSPSNCSSTIPAQGIQPNGNANCGNFPSVAASSGYATLPGGITIQWGPVPQFDTGPSTFSLPTSFHNACLNLSVTDSGTAGRIWSAVSCSTNSYTVHNNGLGSASFVAIGY